MSEMLQRYAEEENMMETGITCDQCGCKFCVGDMVHEIGGEILCWVCYNVKWGKDMEEMT